MLKSAARRLFKAAGFQVSRIPDPLGLNVDRDLKTLLKRDGQPVILDVGANEGQSVRRFKQLFPACEMHSFEPSPTTFQKLKANTAQYSKIAYNQAGVGREAGNLTLQENVHSDMSSFLAPSESCWGNINGVTEVPIITLDLYCENNNIEKVSLLKTDTQGFDYEVLVGASNLLKNRRINIVLTELIFSDMYKGQAPFEEYYKFLDGMGYKLVGFYGFGHQDGLASWCDGLFVNPNFIGKR